MELKESTGSDSIPLQRQTEIGLIYNLKHHEIEQNSAVDQEAEFDELSTVQAIRAVFESHGLKTVLLEADKTLPAQLAAHPIDLAFNIAEGVGGRCREALVPALLDLLGIPYSGSDAAALCIALDKSLCKRLVSTYGIRTPDYAVLAPGDPCDSLSLHYPVIVKPNAEGSSKGISEMCIADSSEELGRILNGDFNLYQEKMLVEEYLPGREFTVGLLGNGEDVQVFAPMEIIYRRNTQGRYRIYSYAVKQDYEKYVSYACPADISEEAQTMMMASARKIFLSLGCHDFSRIDFRMDADGMPCFIEANPLPGLAPGYSDYPMAAAFLGMPYETIVYQVLAAAAKRLGIRLNEGEH